MTRYGTGLMTMLVTTDTAGEAINFEQISSVLSIGLVFSFFCSAIFISSDIKQK